MRRVQSGFGIVEAIIALALGVVIMLGVTRLFTDSSRTLGDVSRATRLTETASYAMDVLTADLALAGFWAERATALSESTIRVGTQRWSDFGVATALDQLPPCACLGTGAQAMCTFDNNSGSVATLDYTEPPGIELVRGMMFPVYGAASGQLNAEASNSGASRCGEFDQASAGSEFVAIRRASTCSATTDTAAGCRGLDGTYHLQVHGEEDRVNSAGATVVRRGDLILTNDATQLTAEMAGGTVAPVYRYISRIYYVDSSDTLSRLFFDASGASQTYTKEPLVEGVELLRFEWHVDTTGDGYANVLTPSPSASEWLNVIAATVWIVVRAPAAEKSYRDNLVYSIAGASFTVPAGYADHRRAVFSRTVELFNIAGRRKL